METRSSEAFPKLSSKTRTPESDLELASAVLRKDRKATAEFVELYADLVYRYVRRRLIPRYDVVDDVVQEVFLAAWDGLATFRAESSLRAWLLSIASHKVQDYYRRRLRDAETLASEEEADDLPLPPIHRHPEELIDKHRIEEKIRATLTGLPETSSLVLLWRYWEMRSAREIAAAIGRSEKGVERLLARARAQFKKKWNNE